MPILVTGGRGKTSSRLSALLHQARVPFVVTSRSQDASVPYQQAHFDWSDETTYKTVLETASFKAVYLLGSGTSDLVEWMKALIDVARSHGVERFVLLSSSALEVGSPGQGQIHEYLMTLNVEYTVLRPSWFQGKPLEIVVRLLTGTRKSQRTTLPSEPKGGYEHLLCNG